MCCELRHEGNFIAITEFEHRVEDVKNGNPYNTSFNMRIVSGVFSGLAECEYNIELFLKFINEIEEMYYFKRDKVELRDICYGSFVSFTMNKVGHIEIKGDIYGNAMLHTLKFEFMADQTSLKLFLDSLKQLYI